MSVIRDKMKTRLEGKMLPIVVNTIFVISIIICISTLTQVILYGYASFFGYSNFRIVSGSMEPTIPVGSITVAKQVDITDVDIDDIIVYVSRDGIMTGEFITHRVIDIVEEDGETYLETQGDANSISDTYYVDEDNFFGEVVFYTQEKNMLTIIFNIVSSPIGFLGVIVIPCFLICSYILSDCMRSIKKELQLLSKIEQDTEEIFTPEEYEELKTIILKELLEEMSNSVEKNECNIAAVEVETSRD